MNNLDTDELFCERGMTGLKIDQWGSIIRPPNYIANFYPPAGRKGVVCDGHPVKAVVFLWYV